MILASRFDLHPITRNAINTAVSLRVIDAAEVAVMAGQHGNDNTAWLEDLCYTAFASSKESHAELCKLNDAYHAATQQ